MLYFVILYFKFNRYMCRCFCYDCSDMTGVWLIKRVQWMSSQWSDPYVCAKISGIATGQTLQLARKKCMGYTKSPSKGVHNKGSWPHVNASDSMSKLSQLKLNMRVIFTVMNATQAVVKIKPPKKFRPMYGSWTYVIGSTSTQARYYFYCCIGSVYYCEDHSHIQLQLWQFTHHIYALRLNFDLTLTFSNQYVFHACQIFNRIWHKTTGNLQFVGWVIHNLIARHLIRRRGTGHESLLKQ